MTTQKDNEDYPQTLKEVKFEMGCAKGTILEQLNHRSSPDKELVASCWELIKMYQLGIDMGRYQ